MSQFDSITDVRRGTTDPMLGLAFAGHHVTEWCWLRAGYWMDLTELGFRFISTPPDRPHRVSTEVWPSCSSAMRAYHQGDVEFTPNNTEGSKQ